VLAIRYEVTSPSTAAWMDIGPQLRSATANDTVDVYFDNIWVVQGSTTSPGTTSITNSGSFESSPRVRITGAVDNFSLTNSANSKVLKLTSTAIVGSTTYYEADILNRTLKDSVGVSKFGELDATSDWLTIDPDENSLSLNIETTATSTGGKVDVFYRNAWL
jgi:hypothetical protein